MKKITFKKIKKISDIIARHYEPEKIILFGSFVWGRPDRDSDVDLLIIKKTKEDKHKIQIFLGRLLFGKGVPVDTLLYTPKEIKKRLDIGDFFIRNIIHKGKILYEKRKYRKPSQTGFSKSLKNQRVYFEKNKIIKNQSIFEVTEVRPLPNLQRSDLCQTCRGLSLL